MRASLRPFEPINVSLTSLAAQMSRVSVRAGWEWRFRFFSELLRDPEGAQVEGDIARCICDPVTLGGAFGLHAVRLR